MLAAMLMGLIVLLVPSRVLGAFTALESLNFTPDLLWSRWDKADPI